MKALRPWAALVLLFAFARLDALPSLLSGEYAEEGVVASDQRGATASFHALLSLEFDPGLAQKLHAQAASVRVAHGDGELAIEVLDRDGVPCKSGKWKVETRRSEDRAAATLRFRVSDEENLLYRFESAAEGRLLQLTIRREQAGTLGPTVTLVGTYLFPRLN